jgi:hypothetical protein
MPLTLREAEARSFHGPYGISVDGNQPTDHRSEVDPECRHRRRVDGTQKDAPAALERDHLGIVQGPVIGEIGIEFEVVDIHLHSGVVAIPAMPPDIAFGIGMDIGSDS